MCRLLAHLGPPMNLEDLLYAPDHSLEEQSWAPRLQEHGTLNADGWGVGWYDPGRRPEPARYRTAKPMWADRVFPSLAGLVDSPMVLAAVRSATPPAAVEESGVPPFTDGPWLFAHNGVIDEWRDAPGERLRRSVSTRRSRGVEGTTDSEVLFAMALDRLDAGASVGDALVGTIGAVLGHSKGRLNLVLTDAVTIAATTWGDTLFTLVEHGSAGRRVFVASEPFSEDEGWEPVPDRSLVTVSADELSIRPIEL